ncbi:hypothetical protein BHM03_00048821, partial [Ensete ventricosum]
MGKAAKGSRKGKKAWRANISTEDIDDYFEKSTKDALTGHAATIASLPSDSLFYLDTKSNAGEAAGKTRKDSLAQAVADEMQNIYKKELGPQPVPVTVPGEPVTEEDKYFLEADDGNESDKEGETGNDDSELPELRYPFVNRFFSFFELLVSGVFPFCSLLCYRFEPAPVQVLLTEEISGSLRKLK